MAYVTVEDLKGSIVAIFFADVYKEASSVLHTDEPVLVKGTMDLGEDSLKVIAQEATYLKAAMEQKLSTVHFHIDTLNTPPEYIEALRDILQKHRGGCEAYVHLRNGTSETAVYLGKELRLNISGALRSEADGVLGQGATRFQ
jgi:DNA polymerase-3 subunit alpha